MVAQGQPVLYVDPANEIIPAVSKTDGDDETAIDLMYFLPGPNGPEQHTVTGVLSNLVAGGPPYWFHGSA